MSAKKGLKKPKASKDAEEALSTALYARFRSRQLHTFAEKLLSAMRLGFGRHTEPKERISPPIK